jgi:hypothetical protein
MTYLAISFAAPALGVFPYLVVASAPSSSTLSQAAFFGILFAANVGISLMIAIMAYTVAYFGVLTPDRVVKHNLVHYMLRGPLVAIAVIFVFMAMPEVNFIMGLPRDMVLVTSVVFVIVVGQLLINLARPAIDLIIFQRDQEEIAWFQELDRRLVTTTDLHQALENILAALCEQLRVRTGFIANLSSPAEARLETRCGNPVDIEDLLSGLDLETLAATSFNGDKTGPIFVQHKGFWFAPLRTKSRETILGLLALEARSDVAELSQQDRDIVVTLASHAGLALEDRALQQTVFQAVQSIIPQIEEVQRLRGTVRYAGSPGLETIPLDTNPVDAPNFTRMVRDALSDYWGGPQLTGSPLLGMGIVQDVVAQYDGNAVRALRAVLGQAIEELRPDGERQMTTAEWLLYNILELKFIQGMRVRNIAYRLALSESDLYRKQRVAIQQVADALAEMEKNRVAEET